MIRNVKTKREKRDVVLYYVCVCVSKESEFYLITEPQVDRDP